MKVVFVVFILAFLAGLLWFGYSAFASGDPLPVGTPAPDFVLEDQSGKSTRLQDYHGKHVVLVFYPGDNTPGCTIQLCSLRDELGKFKAANAEVLASNPASRESHMKFAKAQKYPFPILVDQDKSMAKAYRSLGQGGIVSRTVYIIDKNGVIRYAKRGMPGNDELLSVLKSL